MNLWFFCVCVSVRRIDFPFRYLYWLCRSLFTIIFSYFYHRFSLFCCDVYFKYCFCYSVSKSALVSPPAVERGLIFTRYTHNKRHKCKGKRCVCAFNCTCVRSALPLTLVYDFMNVISFFFKSDRFTICCNIVWARKILFYTSYFVTVLSFISTVLTELQTWTYLEYWLPRYFRQVHKIVVGYEVLWVRVCWK